MTDRAVDVESLIESVLRGTAKIVGCSSASLIVFDEVARESRLRTGVVADSEIGFRDLEDIIGSLHRSFGFDALGESLAFAAWRDRAVVETSELTDLARGAFDADVLAAVDRMAGERRYILVPALSGRRCHGVMLFEKEGRRPFSPQQRELLLRYAHRVAEILEDEPRPDGRRAVPAGGGVVRRLLVDARGALVGGSGPGDGAAVEGGVDPRWLREVFDAARRLLASGEEGPWWVEPREDLGGAAARLRAEVTRLRVGTRDRCLATLVEVRPRAEAEGQQLLHLALGEAAPALLVGPDFRITSCNDAAQRLLGGPRRSLAGAAIESLFRDPDGARAVLNHEFLALSRGYLEEGTVLKRHDGSPFPARIEALLLSDDGDRVVGYLVLVREVSVGPDGLDRLMRRERLATMGELAAQLAHEIRNPLVAIGATLESLAADAAEGRPVAGELTGLQAEIARLDMTLKDYLSVAARHDAAPAPVDLGRLAGEAVRLLARSAKAAARTLECDVPEGLSVLGEADGLRHVLFNLVLNALEAVPPGGHVRCHGQAAGGGVEVRVDDDGPGLPAPAAECCEPFFTTKAHGTGLGLAVCRRVVDAHGGRLSLENRAGGGCRATVWLPWKEEP
jgi:signal transduction histidine kinase